MATSLRSNRCLITAALSLVHGLLYTLAPDLLNGHVHYLFQTAAIFVESFYVASLLEFDSATRFVFGFLLGIAEILVLLETLFFLHHFSVPALILTVDFLLILQGGVLSRFPVKQSDRQDAFLWIAIVAVALRVVTYSDPPIYHDGLTYHLTFAVEWMKRGTLETPLQAYGDQSPPFYPIGSSLLYLWNLASPHSDFWARFTQAPFFILIAAAVLSICEGLSGNATGRFIAVLLLFTIRILRYAHRDQGNDVILSAYLLSATAFLIQNIKGNTVSSCGGFFMAIGLAIGTKYIGLVYAVPLLVWFGIGQLKKSSTSLATKLSLIVAGVAVILALAGFSYVRNYSLTGSALYPAGFDFPGLKAFQPIIDYQNHAFAEMCGSFKDLNSTLGTSWSLIVIISLAGVIYQLRSRLLAQRTFLMIVALSEVALLYTVIPYRHCRFLLYPLLLFVPICGCFLGSLKALEKPWAAKVIRFTESLRSAVIVLCVLVMIAMIVQIPSYQKSRYEHWSSKKVAGLHFGTAWKFLDEHLQPGGLRIAMTATQNIPYPLYGRDFRNTVFYLPPGGKDPDRYYGSAENLFPYTGHTENTWLDSIRQMRPDYLFSTVDMSSQIFGKEDSWAMAHPEQFKQVYQDAEVRIYAFQKE